MARMTGRKNYHLENVLRAYALAPERLPGFFFSSETTVKPDGTYELGQLRSGMNIVEVSLPGYCADTATEIQVPWWPEHHFVLYAGARVGGTVTDATTGQPVENVLIEAFYPTSGGNHVNQSVYSAADGRFYLDGVRAGIPWIGLRTFKEGFGIQTLRLLDVVPGEERSVAIVLKGSGKLSGTVMDSTGAPIQFAGIFVYDQISGDLAVDLMTLEDGSFECDVLSLERPYRLHIGRRSQTSRQGWTILENVTVPCDPIHATLPARGVVAGTVTAEGIPVTSGWVRIGLLDQSRNQHDRRWTEIQAADGSFRFEEIPPGEHALAASVDGHAPLEHGLVVIDPPRTNEIIHELKVEKGVQLTGRVIDGGTGRPVTGAKLAITDLDTDEFVTTVFPSDTTTDGDGRYVMESAPRGRTVGIQVDHPDYALLVSRLLIPKSSPAASRDFSLAQGSTVRVTILDGQDRPVPDLSVSLASQGWHRSSVPTYSGGYARFDRVPAGETYITAGTRGESTRMSGTTFQKEIQLEAGEVREVAFSTAEGGRIVGRVIGPRFRGQERIYNIYVFLRDGTRRHYYKTDTIGQSEFEMFGVKAGTYWVGARTVDAGPRLNTRHEVTVVEDGETTVEFRFGSARVFGEVVDVGQEPVAGAEINIRTMAGWMSQQRDITAREGQFEIAGLDPGTFEYTATGKGFGRLEGQVVLPDEDSEIELSLMMEPEGVIHLAVTDRIDGSTLVPDAICSPMVSALSDPTVVSSGTDLNGRLLFENLRTGEYRLEVRSEPYFPDTRFVSVTSGQSLDVDIGLRRRGNLTIRVEGPDGAPIAGEPIQIIDRESGTSVTEWLARGWVASSTSDLVTNSSGVLQIEGLPEGKMDVVGAGTTGVATVSSGPEPALLLLTRS